jgi:hypothetical protein
VCRLVYQGFTSARAEIIKLAGGMVGRKQNLPGSRMKRTGRISAKTILH